MMAMMDYEGVATATTGHNSRTYTREAWKEGDHWPPVQSDSDEEEVEEEAEEDIEEEKRRVKRRPQLCNKISNF